jgi:2-amino-4-hydroxy-6-hydroxymethyldihydropteridine diphosphokinase
MSKSHLAYLNLGSNIQPETNLPKALNLLSKYGEIKKISNAWESEPVGTEGQNYLNICVLFETSLEQAELKENAIHFIEYQLGRRRSADKFAPRPIDIDIVLFDHQPVGNQFWNLAYVMIPLAELYPEYQNPETGETVDQVATRLRKNVWLKMRQGVIG